jgi:hypothetical protein
MTTLLYGETPGADVQPGNRVDTTSGRMSAVAPPTLTPGAVHPFVRPPFALPGIVAGLAAAAGVLVGLTIAAIALVWSASITPGVQVTLIVLGLCMLAAGLAYIISAPSAHARNATR